MPDSFTRRVKNHLEEIDARASIWINMVSHYNGVFKYCAKNTLATVVALICIPLYKLL